MGTSSSTTSTLKQENETLKQELNQLQEYKRLITFDIFNNVKEKNKEVETKCQIVKCLASDLYLLIMQYTCNIFQNLQVNDDSFLLMEYFNAWLKNIFTVKMSQHMNIFTKLYERVENLCPIMSINNCHPQITISSNFCRWLRTIPEIPCDCLLIEFPVHKRNQYLFLKHISKELFNHILPHFNDNINNNYLLRDKNQLAKGILGIISLRDKTQQHRKNMDYNITFEADVTINIVKVLFNRIFMQIDEINNNIK